MLAGHGSSRVRLTSLVVALVVTLGLVGCGTRETYVPDAVVILNPPAGTPPPIYNARIVGGPVRWPHPPYKKWPHGHWPVKCPKPHVVKPGNTVSGLARYYGVSTASIVQRNSLANPNYIRIGQVLCIPEKGTPGPTITPGGPTLTPPPTATPTGTVVLRTATPGPTTAVPTITPSVAPLRTATPVPTRADGGARLCPSTYAVQVGDTLISVAAKCGVSVAALIEANRARLFPPATRGTLVPGETLTIP